MSAPRSIIINGVQVTRGNFLKHVADREDPITSHVVAGHALAVYAATVAARRNGQVFIGSRLDSTSVQGDRVTGYTWQTTVGTNAPRLGGYSDTSQTFITVPKSDTHTILAWLKDTKKD